jgi:hypothetical protein
MPLADVHDKIADALAAEKADKALHQLTQELRQKLQSGITPETIANMYHISWNSLQNSPRYNTKIDTAIVDLAFKLPQPTDKTNHVFGITKVPSGYAIVVVRRIQSGNMPDKDQIAVFSDTLQSSIGLLEYQAYRQELASKAKIVTTLDAG